MSFISSIIGTAERVPLPDVIIRAAVQRLCSRTATRLASGSAEGDAAFADAMAARAIAEHTDEADAQHHEIPAAFFALVLGPNRKYSSCFYKEPESTLREAEEEALRQTVEHADLADGSPSSNSAAVGARWRCRWRGNFQRARSPRCRIRVPSATTSKPRRPRAD